MTQESDTQPQAKPRRPWGKVFWALLALAVAVPIVSTVVGGVTSPPNSGVPEGHLVYMEANHPSEHTSTLREMFSRGPDGKWHMLVSEQEPQDIDAGSRDWISMPTVSPDGTKVAYYDQSITLQEEIQKLDWQLYVLQIDPVTQKVSKPKLLADLSQDKKAQYFGIAWTPDSKSVVILHDNAATAYDATTGKAMAFDGLSKTGFSDTLTNASRWPSIAKDGSLYFLENQNGAPTVTKVQLGPSASGASVKAGGLIVDHSASGIMTEASKWMSPVSAYAISSEGTRFAVAPANTSDEIMIGSWDGHDVKTLKAAFGRSIFGGRRVTAVKWSPSGRYVGYSVSKPPVGEDEVFYIDTVTGKANKLPFRTGRASWDWGP